MYSDIIGATLFLAFFITVFCLIIWGIERRKKLDQEEIDKQRLTREEQQRKYAIEHEQAQRETQRQQALARQEAERQAQIRAAQEAERQRREEEERREHRRLAQAYKKSRSPSVALRLCKHCQFLNPGDAKTCNQCNADLFNLNNYLARWKCFHCGSVNAGQNQTCHGCHGETRPPDYMWEILY